MPCVFEWNRVFGTRVINDSAYLRSDYLPVRAAAARRKKEEERERERREREMVAPTRGLVGNYSDDEAETAAEEEKKRKSE